MNEVVKRFTLNTLLERVKLIRAALVRVPDDPVTDYAMLYFAVSSYIARCDGKFPTAAAAEQLRDTLEHAIANAVAGLKREPAIRAPRARTPRPRTRPAIPE